MKTASSVILLIILLATACGRPMEEVCAGKFAKLDSLSREARANIVRQQGECQAVAVEFPGDQEALDGCKEALRFVIQTAQSTQEAIDKRLAEPDMKRCADLRDAITPGVGPSFRGR